MPDDRKKLSWGVFGAMILAIVIGLAGEYAEMALTGELPTPLPTTDYAKQIQAINEQQLTSDAAMNAMRGVTATPDTGQNPLEVLFDERLAAATPNGELLLTYCENIRPDETIDCVTWRDAIIAEYAADIARCQSENGNFPACLQEAEIPPPGDE
ncbi:hypothetical protein G4Y79_24095 [Phototrophicus methaneseepsis]|uniref:Uncharacterized protein n=1 Tax=Phototrophicus methaneseepsis TaxID=2710758 RepID=A0A7S8E980_9CHLR|nr:hypothetical protein [Phototrophicus methaneseepsis]QPC82728.1 hypothetical protein G4Y79_24095 [Phototrophicus methaneseepsis]